MGNGARLNVADFRAEARRLLPRFVFDFVDGGAGDEHCMARNEADLQSLCLVPRVLRDTSTIDSSLTVFGQRWSAPIGIAPVGLCGLVRPGGEIAMAQAAANEGLPFVLSTASNSRLEAVRRSAPDAALWMQLYVMQDRAIAEQIVRRARRESYQALVLTVDVPVGGNRERDLRNGFKVPLRPTAAMLLDLLRHPRWLMRLARNGAPNFPNLAENEDSPASAEVQASLLGRSIDRRLVWDSIEWLRHHWDGPLLVKGLLHPEDARQAARRGADGVIVSNHGGRQFDAAPSAISMLPAVLAAVDGRIPVFIDSGFRRGSDIVKAVALGAKAVFVGRAPVWGLACAGREGAQAVLRMLADQVEHAMILAGARRLDDLEPAQLLSAVPTPRYADPVSDRPLQHAA